MTDNLYSYERVSENLRRQTKQCGFEPRILRIRDTCLTTLLPALTRKFGLLCCHERSSEHLSEKTNRTADYGI